MSGYTEQILRYANNLDHVGQLDGADGIGEIGLGESERGSRIAVRFFLKTARQQIDAVKFQAFGCGYTLAACAAAAELAEKSRINEIIQIGREAIDARLGGLPADRGYCADLAAEALRAAVASVGRKGELVNGSLAPHQGHAVARVSSDHPRYRQLIDSPCSADIVTEDRHLLACLLVVMQQEKSTPEISLGLTSQQFSALYRHYFPAIEFEIAESKKSSAAGGDPELLDLLLGYIAEGDEDVSGLPGTLLVRLLAARAACPGHLWVAMGLFERAQLSAVINRHLPLLFAANHQGMRWKRFFYRQICEQQGGILCKSPICGDCSEYHLCFPPE